VSDAYAPAVACESVERYVSRIEEHLVRFAEGHDPLGHLFAIERLARVARAEQWETVRHPKHEPNSP
jgi:hypothetical protein